MHGEQKTPLKTPNVTVGASGITPEQLLQVQLTPQVGGKSCITTAVANTGAQVCVASPSLMLSLGLQPTLLQCRAGLIDLAKIPLASLRSAPCRISILGRSILQEVHFVGSVECLYLLCAACKYMELVHSSFPLPRASTAAVVMEEDDPTCPSSQASLDTAAAAGGEYSTVRGLATGAVFIHNFQH